MRLLFYAFLLIIAIAYSYMAFNDLSFLTNRGRVGPGFFPRFIGVLLVLSIVIAMFNAAKGGKFFKKEAEGQVKDVTVLIGLSVSFGILLMFAGYLIATALFVGGVLVYFNSRHLLMNGAITLTVPFAVYVLFGQILNASLPMGIW
ncbi:tripartite tricarboxylate transporter TctB family protein [Vreelandella sp. EE22]